MGDEVKLRMRCEEVRRRCDVEREKEVGVVRPASKVVRGARLTTRLAAKPGSLLEQHSFARLTPAVDGELL